jgi:hypothetical protein
LPLIVTEAKRGRDPQNELCPISEGQDCKI